MAVKVARENNKLKIELPLEPAVPSKSGKTLLVASTHGVITTEVRYKGKPIVLVLNAFIYPSDQRRRASAGCPATVNRRGDQSATEQTSRLAVEEQ